MATEIRRMIMEPKEVRTIISYYSQVEGSPLPRGTVIGFKIISEAPVKLSVNLQSKKGDQVQVDMVEHEIISACLSFFLENKIPVSRKSQKMVKISDGKIIFEMALDQLDIVPTE